MARQKTEDKSDAYLRWKIKKSYARIEPPSDGKKRLLKAAYEETSRSDSRFNHLNRMFETENYQEDHGYLSWVLAARFHMTFLSTLQLR